MPAPPGSTPRPASIHEAIRREVMAQLDSRWHKLWGTFGMSVILMSFGAQLAWHQWDEQWMTSVALLVAGSLLWLVHRQQVAQWHAHLGADQDSAWLSVLDQIAVAAGLLAAVLVPPGQGWWPIPLVAGSAWGLLRLSHHAQAHWAHWHFMVARKMLRDQRRRTLPTASSSSH